MAFITGDGIVIWQCNKHVMHGISTGMESSRPITMILNKENMKFLFMWIHSFTVLKEELNSSKQKSFWHENLYGIKTKSGWVKFVGTDPRGKKEEGVISDIAVIKFSLKITALKPWRSNSHWTCLYIPRHKWLIPVQSPLLFLSDEAV